MRLDGARRRSPRWPASRSRSPSRRSPPTRSSSSPVDPEAEVELVEVDRGRRGRRRARRRGRASSVVSSLAGRRVVLGVTGGIAAYKAIEVCRRLVDAGAHVVPVMTKGAEHFVGRTTLSALASEPVRDSLWDDADPIPHTRLGQAPTSRRGARPRPGCSAPTPPASRTTCSRPRCSPPGRRCVVCPAMHTEMWEHPAVQENLATLAAPRRARRRARVRSPGRRRRRRRSAGRARGDRRRRRAGARPGRPRRPARRGDRRRHPRADRRRAGHHQPLVGQAGLRRRRRGRRPGRRGHARHHRRAARARRRRRWSTSSGGRDGGRRGAARRHGRRRRDGRRRGRLPAQGRRPTASSRRTAGRPSCILEPTTDILAGLGAAKRPGQTLVGFAAETDDVEANAAAKLRRKHLDLIVANDVSAPGVGFEHDTNAVTILVGRRHRRAASR